jgi:hypothetical protein
MIAEEMFVEIQNILINGYTADTLLHNSAVHS